MERKDNFKTINEITEVVLLPVIRSLKSGTEFTIKDITPSVIYNELNRPQQLGKSLGDFVQTQLINVRATSDIKDDCIVYIKE